MGRNFMSAAILDLQLQGENFFQLEKFEISQFQAVHCVRKKAISPKVFNRFQKLSCCSKMWKIGVREKISGAQLF